MAELFRDSGFEKTAFIASKTGAAATIINAPGENKNIYLLGSNSTATATIKEGDANGNFIMVVAAGNANFPGTVKVTENTGIFVDSVGTTTLFYYIA